MSTATGLVVLPAFPLLPWQSTQVTPASWCRWLPGMIPMIVSSVPFSWQSIQSDNLFVLVDGCLANSGQLAW